MYQTSQGREFLLSLEQDAAWISAQVLPFLANGGKEGDGKEPEKSQLAARIIEVRRRDHDGRSGSSHRVREACLVSRGVLLSSELPVGVSGRVRRGFGRPDAEESDPPAVLHHSPLR